MPNGENSLVLTEHDFSKDADRLLALSGLAKQCQSQGAGKYLAGLWENDLLKSLVWHPRTDETVQRWEEYMAPTWSPFSVGVYREIRWTQGGGLLVLLRRRISQTVG